jgi:hypothetical protein
LSWHFVAARHGDAPVSGHDILPHSSYLPNGNRVVTVGASQRCFAAMAP